VNEHFIERLAALVLARRAELAHPRPELAVPLGFTMFVGALRETTVFSEAWPHASALSDEELGAELGRTLLGYLASSRSEAAAPASAISR
jgi:hypothetical protein